ADPAADARKGHVRTDLGARLHSRAGPARGGVGPRAHPRLGVLGALRRREVERQVMAEVTLGIGSSHSPMLSTPHEALAQLGELDRGRLPEFAAKARESASWIARELTPEVMKARHEATQAAIQELGGLLAKAAPDVLGVVGDDQDEWFSADNQPAL